METSTPDNRTLHEYLGALRSGSPTPGGGSAAAYAGAMGASLAAMVCRLTLASANDGAEHSLAPAADRLDTLVDELSESARRDEKCYARYRAAAALPKTSPEEKQARSLALQASLHTAAETPLLTARRALEALSLAALVAELGTKHALSDVDVARSLLSSSIDGALVFVAVNAASIKDDNLAADLMRRAEEIRTEAAAASYRAVDTLRSRA
jgi:formiminotetrahydrofolate cyclodeaminase